MIPSSPALPQGESVHEGLKFRFVDLPNFIIHLTESNFTGYLALTAGEQKGLALVNRGVLSDAFVSSNGATESGQPALRQLLLMPRDKDGHVSARKLSEAFVASYASLNHGKDTYSRLDGMAVNFQDLLASLTATLFSGCIQIESGSQQGFVFFFGGTSLGGFYRQADLLIEEMGRVYQISAESNAIFSVFTAPTNAAPALVLPRLTKSTEVKLLAEVLERVLQTLIPLAGSKVQEYFSASLVQIRQEHPWLADLNINPNGVVILEAMDPTGIALDEAVQSFIALINRCLEQGYGLFGESVIRANLEKDLAGLRYELDAIGFPRNWP